MLFALSDKPDSRKRSTGGKASVEITYFLTGASDKRTAKVLIENSAAVYPD
jgi:hypothetical protein